MCMKCHLRIYSRSLVGAVAKRWRFYGDRTGLRAPGPHEGKQGAVGKISSFEGWKGMCEF